MSEQRWIAHLYDGAVEEIEIVSETPTDVDYRYRSGAFFSIRRIAKEGATYRIHKTEPDAWSDIVTFCGEQIKLAEQAIEKWRARRNTAKARLGNDEQNTA